jgi:hypothetical protein
MRRIAAVYEGFDITENFFAAYAPYNNRILGLGQNGEFLRRICAAVPEKSMNSCLENQ